jgi:hypothetical protein
MAKQLVVLGLLALTLCNAQYSVNLYKKSFTSSGVDDSSYFFQANNGANDKFNAIIDTTQTSNYYVFASQDTNT